MSNSTAANADWLTVQWFKQLFGHGDRADKPASQDRTRMTIYGAGASVIRMDDPANKFYILAKGEAQVSKPGNAGLVYIAVLSAGAHTGEIGLLNGGTRTANVTARTDCVFLALTAEDFIEVIKAQPKLRQDCSSVSW